MSVYNIPSALQDSDTVTFKIKSLLRQFRVKSHLCKLVLAVNILENNFAWFCLHAFRV